MSASSKIPSKSMLRGILRCLKVNQADLREAQQRAPGSSATIKYVLERYRCSDSEANNDNNNNNKRAQELHKMAYEYTILRQAIDERIRLKRLDTGAENQLSPMEMSRRAAARAGLQLPELDPELK